VTFCVFAYKILIFLHFAPPKEVGQNFAPLEKTEMTSLQLVGNKLKTNSNYVAY